MKRRKINWRSGNGAILLGVVICVMGLLLMTGTMETMNLYQGATVAQTRADLISDGAAAYGISYDDTLDPGRVAIMSSLLLATNADYDNPISMRVDYGMLQDQKVRVQVTTQRKLWFPKEGQSDEYKVSREAISRVISN